MFQYKFENRLLTFSVSKLHLANSEVFFFYPDFLSQTFTIHRTAGEGGGYFCNSSLPLPLASTNT